LAQVEFVPEEFLGEPWGVGDHIFELIGAFAFLDYRVGHFSCYLILYRFDVNEAISRLIHIGDGVLEAIQHLRYVKLQV